MEEQLNENAKKSSKFKKPNSKTDENGINNYHKKHVMHHLTTNGLSKHTFNYAATNFKNKHLVNAFFTECIKDAEKHVQEECDSLCFRNINSWLKVLQKSKLHEHCLHEPGMLINSMNKEKVFENKTDTDGIDLNEIYAFISKALMGQPQKPMSAASTKFLINEFEDLIKNVNTNKADVHTKKLKHKLFENLKKNSFDYKNNVQKASLDPFCLDKTI